MDNYDEDVKIGASLEALTRQVTERCLQELAALRAAIDQRIASIEARLDESDHKPLIQATARNISKLAAKRADRERQEAGSTAAQAMAAIEADLHARLGSEVATNNMLRTALENVKAENKNLTTALDEAQAQLLDARAQLKSARRDGETRSVSPEDVAAVKATAEAEYQELISASQKLTDALAQMRREHEDPRAGTTKIAAVKKPLQFSGPARDVKRVKIRRDIPVNVDGIPGELVDLSIGGAQAILTQAVIPNQLVRLTIPSADGPLTCKGRIVWAIYEQPATSLAVYRTGVKFTDVDEAAVENFMKDFCERPTMTSSRQSSGVG